MAFSYGLTFPAAFLRYQSEEYPDLFKFYTAVPTRSTESSAANKRRPVLFTSLNGGVRWKFESQTSSTATHGFYDVNYGGNFYFDAVNPNASYGILMALAHKSVSSSYGAYKARAGYGYPLTISNQSWEWSSVVGYNLSNQPSREICKNLDSNTNSSRYFCIKDGGGYGYNTTAWSTANWTTLNLPSDTTLNDDGGFRHICINPEKEHEGLVFLTSNNSNKYLKFYLFNPADLGFGTNYTSTVCLGYTNWKQTNYKYVSIGFLPEVGYLIFYNYSSGSKGTEVIILRTHNKDTGEHLPYNQYVADGPITIYGADAAAAQYGMHGWYCPWTKEYYFVPNARIVLWTKDGETWEHSSLTSSAATAQCDKFITDGQSMVLATSGSAFYYSRDKGQTWANDYTISPNCFNTDRGTDTIVIPFKCVNNIGIDTSDLILEKSIDRTTGEIVDSSTNFYLNGFIPVDPDTSYVFYGACKTPHDNIPKKRKTWFNRILYYDSNHNFISGKEGADYTTTNSPNREVPCIFTSPSNAAYARVTCNMENVTATQELVVSYKWYFAKESDFVAMTNYGNIVCD